MESVSDVVATGSSGVDPPMVRTGYTRSLAMRLGCGCWGIMVPKCRWMQQRKGGTNWVGE